MSPQKEYDVFVSYSSSCRTWVDVLVDNLTSYGFKVFYDQSELPAGYSLHDSLFQGLRLSRKGIVVVTPEAYESPWVRQEYDQMLTQEKEDPAFQVIPVVLGKGIDDFAFIKCKLWLDFSEPGHYRDSFYRLVCALQNRQPGSNISLEVEPLIPPIETGAAPGPGNDEVSFVNDLFDHFYNYQAMMLLVQADRWQWGFKELLLEKAHRRFGVEKVINLVFPLGEAAAAAADTKTVTAADRAVDRGTHYKNLGRQCGFDRPTRSTAELLDAFHDRITQQKELFLMVNGFEYGSTQQREELAGVLRSLNELYPALRILLCGGEKLEDVTVNGSLSYLNRADITELSELTPADVVRLAKSACAGQKKKELEKLNENEAERLLEISGGNPRVLSCCFDLYSRDRDFTTAGLKEYLLSKYLAWQLFYSFKEDEKLREKVLHLLAKDDVGPAPSYIFNPLLRKLYWLNLLKRDSRKRRLIWRCEALRQAGIDILSGQEC